MTKKRSRFIVREQHVLEQAGPPEIFLLDLWHSLCASVLDGDMEVVAFDIKESPQLLDKLSAGMPPGSSVHTAFPRSLDGIGPCLVLYLDFIDKAIQEEVYTHELCHWILKLQGFPGVICDRESPLVSIEGLLNDAAVHPAVYSLQTRSGRSENLDQEAESFLSVVTSNPEAHPKRERIVQSLILFEYARNASPVASASLLVAAERYWPTVAKMTKRLMRSSDRFALTASDGAIGFLQEAIGVLGLEDDFRYLGDEEIENMRKLVDV